jgi:hypothetical protein
MDPMLGRAETRSACHRFRPSPLRLFRQRSPPPKSLLRRRWQRHQSTRHRWTPRRWTRHQCRERHRLFPLRQWRPRRWTRHRWRHHLFPLRPWRHFPRNPRCLRSLRNNPSRRSETGHRQGEGSDWNGVAEYWGKGREKSWRKCGSSKASRRSDSRDRFADSRLSYPQRGSPALDDPAFGKAPNSLW